MHYAAGGGHTEVMKILLDHGAEPNIQVSYGRTALHEAASSKNAEIGRILLDHNADPALEFYGRPVSAEFLNSLWRPTTDTQG